MERTVTQDIFKKRRRALLQLFGSTLIIYVVFSRIVGFQFTETLHAIPESFWWLFTNFIPTEDSLTSLPLILTKLLQTVLMAITATMTAACFALFTAIVGSKTTGINRGTKFLTRALASFFRNVPIVVWAMIFLLSFKQSEFTGYLAITFTTYGYLTRAFMETIDEVAESVLDAMEATGASYLVVIFQGVLPMVFGQLISWILFLIENNIRDATLVGILTGTGIGFLFDLFYKKFRYDMAGMITLTIVIVVIILELSSNKIRRMIH
ncbi:MAG: phosphate/phosphonate ABC transporter permease [Enterococcus sp.]